MIVGKLHFVRWGIFEPSFVHGAAHIPEFGDYCVEHIICIMCHQCGIIFKAAAKVYVVKRTVEQ